MGNQKLKILVLGASGGIGSWVVKLGAQRGHHITALVRPDADIDFQEGKHIHIIKGEALEEDDLKKALEGSEVVISCLGLRRRNPKNPWSPLISPPGLTRRVTEKLVFLMKKQKIKRIVAISAAGVGDSYTKLSWPVHRMVNSGQVATAYLDLNFMEEVLEKSGLDWLCVRPVTLVDGKSARAQVIERYGLLSKITRYGVANWILDAVETKEPFTERTPMIGE